MPKINWAAADEDEELTAEDIENAEDGFETYAGDIPTGGVYRFRWRRGKYTEFGTGNQGLNVLLVMDGSWKKDHAKYNGCPLWDRIVMTKSAAGFVKAFAAALGVSANDLLTKVIVDEDGVVTKIGRKVISEDIILYVAVKRGTWNDEPRLEKAGTGYQVVEIADSDEEPADDAKPSKKPATAKAGKGKKSKADDDEPPF
jgi:hypothetical protein